MNYDVIGDVHGQYDKLVALLRTLGYRETMRAWRHPDRTAVFVGDFIDRGPKQVETLKLVRGMVDTGAAMRTPNSTRWPSCRLRAEMIGSRRWRSISFWTNDVGTDSRAKPSVMTSGFTSFSQALC